MSRRSFREISLGRDPGAMASILGEDVAFHSPVLIREVRGRELVQRVFASAASVAGLPNYSAEFHDDSRTLLLWDAKVAAHPLEIALVLSDDAEGKVGDIRVLMRPWPVVTLFRDGQYARLHEHIPDEYWVLPGQALPAGG